MRVRLLKPRSYEEEDLLQAVARARGCSTPEETADFLSPEPPIRNHLESLEGYVSARERIAQSILRAERLLLFGDYDCDGITSVVQMHDLLRAARHPSFAWFVPDRMTHDYGLTMRAVREAVEGHEPGLVIALDCGSSSLESIQWMKDRGIDCIVVDHHAVIDSDSLHPALAHLNPRAGKTESPEIRDLSAMSASGLTYLFCELLARDLRLGAWDRERSLVLAGLGTVVDVMPLLGGNRTLVKHALRLVNQPQVLARIPGLAALAELVKSEEIDVRTFGFHWGPRLNAAGRLGSSHVSVELLMAPNLESARPLAATCDQANKDRRALQQEMEETAMAMAEERLGLEPPDNVILLCDQAWHPGIVGTVASRVKDAFCRPAIICGWHEDGYWKGSGRSPAAFDLGGAVHAAAESGLLLGGGGHRMAAGIRLHPDQEEPFRAWLQKAWDLEPEDLEEEQEILAEAKVLDFQDQRDLAQAWCRILEPLEPFGAANPAPGLYLANAELRWGPRSKQRRSDGSVWAVSAGFGWPGSGYLFADWTQTRRALSEWRMGGRYDLVLSVSSRGGIDRQTGRPVTWYDWTVVDCRRVWPARDAAASRHPRQVQPGTA